MPLGSAPKTTIDIDYTRAQGAASKGRILFQPPRQKVGTTMLSDEPVPAELVQGVATIELARLPIGTYKAIEQLEGRAQRSFDFALPLSAPEIVQYEDIVQVSAVPARYTAVSKINGIPPDPITGNITLVTGGATNLNGLTDVTLSGPTDQQALLFDLAGGQWRNLSLAAAALSGQWSDILGTPVIPNDPSDIGAAGVEHDHTVSQITDFISAVDARIQVIVGSAPASLDTLAELAAALNNDNDFATSVTTALAGKAALVHSHTIAQITGLQVALDAKAALAHIHAMEDIAGLVTALSAKQRSITSRSLYITTGSINPLPNTGAGWAAVAVEGSIPAAVGDRIRMGARGIRNSASNVYLDFATVTGSGPTVIKRYLSTGTSSSSPEGDPAWYHSNAFINQSGPRQITVGAADLDGANVRISAVCKGNGTGILYAEASYPFYMLLENMGPEPL